MSSLMLVTLKGMARAPVAPMRRALMETMVAVGSGDLGMRTLVRMGIDHEVARGGDHLYTL